MTFYDKKLSFWHS